MIDERETKRNESYLSVVNEAKSNNEPFFVRMGSTRAAWLKREDENEADREWIQLLRIWKTNDRDWSNMSVEQFSVALRMISARLAQTITNRETRA